MGAFYVADTLDALTDVVISSPAVDQVIKYNGTNWVNAAAPGGGGGGVSPGGADTSLQIRNGSVLDGIGTWTAGTTTLAIPGTITATQGIVAASGGPAKVTIAPLAADNSFTGVWCGSVSLTAANSAALFSTSQTVFNASNGLFFQVGNSSRFTADGAGAYVNAGNTKLYSFLVDGSIVVNDANPMVLHTGALGAVLGATSGNKLSFWGATPVVRPTAVADATGSGDAHTQLNALLARLRTIGLIAL